MGVTVDGAFQYSISVVHSTVPFYHSIPPNPDARVLEAYKTHLHLPAKDLLTTAVNHCGRQELVGWCCRPSVTGSGSHGQRDNLQLELCQLVTQFWLYMLFHDLGQL